jgi:large subunit ribosomal protein L9|tara:strand:+ start:1301 stop:1933 length:633 start_codon:yes stop_codon:yes gene_type:complete
MQIILLERIEKLGQMGDIVTVKPGFARNYLLPQKKALRANKANMAVFENQRAQLEAENLKRRDEAEAVSAKVDGLRIIIIRQAGDSGQLYGSVASRDVAESVTKAGTSVARSQIVLDRPIKTLGLHDIRIRLHPEVTVGIVLNVARSEAEAELQESAGRFVSVEEQQNASDAAEAEALVAAEVEAEAEAESAGANANAADDSDDEKQTEA